MLRVASKVLFLGLITNCFIGIPAIADEPLLEGRAQPDGANTTFERKQFTVSRQRGKIYFDGAEAPLRKLQNKSKEIRLIETFDGLDFESEIQFHHWAQRLRGTRTYTYDEVTQNGADGNSFTQPLVFFDKDQRIELDKKWLAWLDKRNADIEEANRVRLAKEQEAKLYQQHSHLQNLQAQALTTQSAAAERSADSLAVISGATSLWEVELVPSGSSTFCSNCSTGLGGFYTGTQSFGLSLYANGSGLTSAFDGVANYDSGRNSIYVQAYGRTSQIAGDQALKSNPGYRVGSIRKLAGN